jgi:hypothetical protein
MTLALSVVTLLQTMVSLIDTARVIIYDLNMFIIQATVNIILVIFSKWMNQPVVLKISAKMCKVKLEFLN